MLNETSSFYTMKVGRNEMLGKNMLPLNEHLSIHLQSVSEEGGRMVEVVGLNWEIFPTKSNRVNKSFFCGVICKAVNVV